MHLTTRAHFHSHNFATEKLFDMEKAVKNCEPHIQRVRARVYHLPAMTSGRQSLDIQCHSLRLSTDVQNDNIYR